MITEQEKLEIKAIADDLAYLMTEAHGKGFTFEQINDFMDKPHSVANIDAADEDLQRVAALVYAHTQCLKHQDYTIRMHEGEYKINIKFHKTPF